MKANLPAASEPSPAILQRIQELKRFATSPDVAELSEAQKQTELATIKDEINSKQREIEANEKAATKLLIGSVFHAQKIGCKLERAFQLLPPRKFKTWIEDNFSGKYSTANQYRDIFNNWGIIGPKATKGMSIREAVALVYEHRSDKRNAKPSKQIWAKKLTLQFSKLISNWPPHALETLVEDSEFMSLIKRTAKKRNKEIVQALQAKYAQNGN